MNPNIAADPFCRHCAPVDDTNIIQLDKGRNQCYTYQMEEEEEEIAPRAFKTEWFAKAAKKAKITDAELCKAIEQVRLRQCDDLGGEVFKKRLNKNMHRSIIVAKGGKYWVYTFLFAKRDRENIDSKELHTFRELADLYANKTDDDIKTELAIKVLVEICHGEEI